MTSSASDRRPVVVYLAGMGRSGSTLLDRLLGQLDGWWSLGEVVHLLERGLVRDERCGCGARFSECPVWTAIGRHAFGGWDRVDVVALRALQAGVERDRFVVQLLRPGLDRAFRRRLHAWNDVVRRIMLAAHEVTGARVLVDASKHVSTLLARRHVPGIDLLPVHLVRDSRGVAYSWTKAVARPATDGQEQMSRWSPIETSLRYVGYNAVLARVLGDRSVHLRYEDMVADPREALHRIVACQGDDVELPSMERTAEGWAVELGSSHGFSGNPMRARAGTTTIRQDVAWIDALPVRDRRLVTALTLPSLRRDGYDLRPREAGA